MSLRESLLVILTNQKQFSLSLHYSGDESYIRMNKSEICKFKHIDNMTVYQFCLGYVSSDVTNDERIDVSLNVVVYDFSIDYVAIDTEDQLNILGHLILKYLKWF